MIRFNKNHDLLWKGFAALLGCAAAFSAPSRAEASFYSEFSKVTSNSEGNPNIGSQISFTMYDSSENTTLNTLYGFTVTSSQVAFVFKNNVGNASSVTDIYFQDGPPPSGTPKVLGSVATLHESAGVSMATTAATAPPGANNLSPAWSTTFQVSTSPNPPTNGINASTEWLGVVFNVAAGKTSADVYQALGNWAFNGNPPNPTTGTDTRWSLVNPTGESLRVALHVKSIAPGGGSDIYVSVVPEPSSFALIGVGMMSVLAVGSRKLLRKDSASA